MPDHYTRSSHEHNAHTLLHPRSYITLRTPNPNSFLTAVDLLKAPYTSVLVLGSMQFQSNDMGRDTHASTLMELVLMDPTPGLCNSSNHILPIQDAP